jgi:hypothetical protein
MNKPFPKFCKDCAHSEPVVDSEWNLQCFHPVVNSKDPWALSASPRYKGTSCREERQSVWFAPCGRKGKLWEPKP